MAHPGGDAEQRNQNLYLHDGHSYDIDHHDHYSGYVHDVKLGLAIKFLFDKDQNVSYFSLSIDMLQRDFFMLATVYRHNFQIF